MTFYDILDVRRDATEDEIRRAYRRIAIAMHPDRNADPGAEEVMRLVNEAWSTLGDPGRRRGYDSLLRGDRPLTRDERAASAYEEYGGGPPLQDDDFLPTMHRLRVPITAAILVLLFVIFVFTAYAPRR